MKAVIDLLRREALWPLWVVVVAAVIILPGLWSFGFWEPGEIAIADQARAEVEGARSAEAGEPEREAAERKPTRAERIAEAEPPLTEWAIGRGVRQVGVSELGARLPLALMGILAALVTFLLGRRLASARAGLIAALVLLSLPLFLFQSRQLMSSIGAVLGGALLVMGACGIAWPERDRERHPLWRYAVDVSLIVAGALLSYYGARALLGLVVPLGAVGLATAGALYTERRAVLGTGEAGEPTARAVNGTWRWHRAHLWIGAAVCIVAGLAAFVWVFLDVYEIRDPVPGTRQILGKSFVPLEDPSSALGGVWTERDDLEATFDTLFHQLAFGLFPWIALIPVAAARLALGPRTGRRAWAGYVVFAWALLAWLVATLMERKVGSVHYPALPAVAIAVGMWLDDLFTARRHAAEDDLGDRQTRRRLGMPVRLPLVALFVFFAALVVAKDIRAFPDELTAVHVLDGSIKTPENLSLTRAHVVFGGLFGLSLALGLWLWRPAIAGSSLAATLWWRVRRFGPHLAALAVGAAVAVLIGGLFLERAGVLAALVVLALAAVAGAELGMRTKGLVPRRAPAVRGFGYYEGRTGVPAALTVAALYALFLSHVWTPHLSEAFSSKHLFSVYRDLRAPGDELVIVGNMGSGPDWYADSDYQQVAGRNELLTALSRDDARVFAVAPASDLCAIHRASARTFEYYVHDDSHATRVLLSNRLEDGETDRNPLARAIRREPPTDIQHPMSVNFDNKVELIGYDMPRRVGRGDSFEMTLYFKVLKPVGGSWKVIGHIDRGNMRINADHDPIGGRCATSFWQEGDYIVDTFTVAAGDISFPKGPYQVFTGFFQGGSGNWTNMKVVSGNADQTDRVPLGTIMID